MTDPYRTERDSLGEIRVPVEALYGAQTQRALNNFRLSQRAMPRSFIRALGLIKMAAANVNAGNGDLTPEMADAIAAAAMSVAEGDHDDQFPIDVFQTGSGTSTNMNANEVIATLARQSSGTEIHPNDHVNMSQSSNDVIPGCIHVAAALQLYEELVPALEFLQSVIAQRSRELGTVVKTGRTHLMDAVPLTFGQELSGWQQQIRLSQDRLQDSGERLLELAVGGTAVGTGLNAPVDFGSKVAEFLSRHTGIGFRSQQNFFSGISSQDTAVELSGQLRTLAVALMKICNDLRWMNSGPLTGIAEIELQALQPGSSIMPGKVNPVIPEAVSMACAQVMGNDACVAVAGQSGNFQLNVMLPVIASNLLESISLLSNGCRSLASNAIATFQVRSERVEHNLSRNPILVTALNRVVGYETGALIAKRAYSENRPVLDVASEELDMARDDIEALLEPLALCGIERKSD